MSVVSLLGVKVLNNPANFGDAYEFEITFECLETLQKDLEWKLTYVGSATSSEHDQELDSLLVGPIPIGVNKFIFEATAPDLKRIPTSEIIGVTVILLTCSYDEREFVRVGYYVNNEYDNPEMNAEPPAKPVIEKVRRNVLSEKPRVTRFAIKWDSEDSAPAEYPPDQPEADILPDDGAAYGAEEVELENALLEEDAALEKVEAEEAAAAAANPAAQTDGDHEMGDADAPPALAANRAKKDVDDESDAGSEDLEAESSGSDDEEEVEEEGEADEDMDMGDGEVEKGEGVNGAHAQEEVMAH